MTLPRPVSPGPVLCALGLLLPIALIAVRTLAAPRQIDPPDLHMETIAHIGGPSLAVAAMGERVLLGEGEHVLVVDVSRTSAPVVIGRSERLGDTVLDIAVAGEFAFVTADGAGLQIVDVAEPSQPRRRAIWDIGRASRVVVAAGRAYVLANADLHILDVADPTAPRELGSLDSHYADALAVAGDVVWLTSPYSGSGGLTAVDVSDPAQPRELARIAGSGNMEFVETDGRWVYVVENAGLVVYDGAQPASVRRVSTAALNGPVRDSHLAAGRLYLAMWDDGVAVFGVGAGTASLREAFGTLLRSDAVTAANGLTFVTVNIDLDFDSSDRAPATAPGLLVYRGRQLLGRLPTLGLARNLAVDSGRTFVAADSGGVVILDTTAPRRPANIARLDTRGPALGVAVDGDTLLVAAGDAGVSAYDLRDSASPRPGGARVGQFDAGPRLHTVVAAGGTAWAAGWTDLLALDYRLPGTLAKVGAYAPAAHALGLSLSQRDGTLFVVKDNPDLALLDVTDPAQVAPIGTLDTFREGSIGTAIDASGGVAYLGQTIPGWALVTRPPPQTCEPGPCPPTPVWQAAPLSTSPPDDGRLTIVDIATPSAPRARGVVDRMGPISAVRADGMRVYVGGYGNPMSVVDASDPDAPRTLDVRFDGPDPWPPQAADIEVVDDLVYVGALEDGLFILRPLPADAPTATTTPTWPPRRTPTPTTSPTAAPLPADTATTSVGRRGNAVLPWVITSGLR